ncbi:hypothetical protein E2C01_017444 [Portunus trituberculatus]|uniref:Uncharacterized protein n=1 Tax=Portunus trituberculatus TaxID=210409 RepID=A0A5B7DTQ1_PORTR|nr:hypothetical protein [Portunus trituberculatus]
MNNVILFKGCLTTFTHPIFNMNVTLVLLLATLRCGDLSSLEPPSKMKLNLVGSW